MYLLGYDIGSSSVKASLVEAATGRIAATDFSPRHEEMAINAPRAGWAEQDPEQWWANLSKATASVLATAAIDPSQIGAIGISYQMHGLVMVDRQQRVLRPSIIWCDSRAVPYGAAAFDALGADYCLSHLLNSPGNFTAAKLAWVRENQPEIYEQIDKIMLPGDYIAMRLTGRAATTVEGLSEGIFWDFKENRLSEKILSQFGFESSVIPEIVPTFAPQGEVLASVGAELGLRAGIPVCYRAGDQPNNALSLNVFEPGEVASTAGTSGVVYGVSSSISYDPQSRVNSFAHVNHTAEATRLGIMLCINGTGSLNSWARRNIAPTGASYPQMNDIAAQSPIGSDGVVILPFGNGAERVLGNRDIGASMHGVNFNIHNRSHLLRASQEGIVFSFIYGMEIMQAMGMNLSVIRAGETNMFQSPIFRDTLSGTSGARVELYETDGAVGAAKGAGVGVGYYKTPREAFETLTRTLVVEPPEAGSAAREAYVEAYARWKKTLNQTLDQK